MANPIIYRSTNAAERYVHFGGAVLAGVEHGAGIELNPVASTTTAPNIMPFADEANKGLTIQPKGTGTLTLCSSANQPLTVVSTVVTLNGGAAIGASGTLMREARAFTVQFTAPTLSSGFAASAAAVESTFTVAGVSTGTVLMFTPTNPINAYYNVRARCSTVNELTLAFSHNGISTLGSGESTNRGTLLQFTF